MSCWNLEREKDGNLEDDSGNFADEDGAAAAERKTTTTMLLLLLLLRKKEDAVPGKGVRSWQIGSHHWTPVTKEQRSVGIVRVEMGIVHRRWTAKRFDDDAGAGAVARQRNRWMSTSTPSLFPCPSASTIANLYLSQAGQMRKKCVLVTMMRRGKRRKEARTPGRKFFKKSNDRFDFISR